MARKERALATTARTVVLQTAPLLIIYALVELVAGYVLSGAVSRLEALPGILIMLPALLAMRGDIGEPFAARVATGLHLRTIRPGRWTPDLLAAVYSSLILTVIVSLLLGVVSWGFCAAAGVGCLTLGQFVTIAFVSGTVSGIVLMGIGLLAAFYSFAKGIDPDDVVTPTVGSLGDVIAVLVFVAVFSAVL